MLNNTMYELGAMRSCIRELFEYGLRQAKAVGKENVFDYSLGNPSIPAPALVNESIRDIVENENTLQVHGYTSAAGYDGVRKAVADDLNARFQAGVRPENLFFAEEGPLSGTLEKQYYLGDVDDCRVRIGDTLLRVITGGYLFSTMSVGQSVRLQIRDMMVFPDDGQLEQMLSILT